VKRFPDHAGLRFSLARAYRALNRNPDANRVFADLVERRPNDISALINLGWIQHREADTAGGLRTLERAQVQAPRDPRPLDQRAQMLIDAGRRDEAIATVETMMRSIPSSVQTYDWAIGRLSQLNLFERAVEAARAGTRTFPRGAYLWLLLGKMLQQNSDLAAPGEVETCLRQSLRQNATLFESVDWLAILLLEQQREEEAKQLLLEVERHMADPAAARGRLAWIRRQGEEKKQALEDMEAVVRDAPWYSWGWYRLLEWLQEDQRWEQARASLATIPPAMLHDFQFRRKRVELLEKAGALSSTTDPEWDALLSDLPEETPLHLGRFDALGKAGRMREAAELLRRLLPAEQDNVYLRARMVQVDCFEKNFAAAVEDAMVVAFTRNDESEWPVNQVWEQIRAAGHLEEFTRRFMLGLKQGKEPAERALVLYAEHLFAGEYPSFQWIRRSWLHAATRNIRRLVRLVERSSWVEEHHLAKLMEVLNKEGYRRMVVACWRRMKARGLGSETAAWAQTGSALINLQKKGEARALLADWRTRRGIKMWMLANYLIALPRMSQSGCDEVIRTCREALEKLPHDHCARYLVYMGAEACVLIGDREGLMAFCETHRGYVAGTPQPGEFFPAWQRYLVDELLVAVRLVANPGEAGWGRVRWKLRLKRLWTPATRARARQIFILLVRIAAIATLSGGTLLRLFR
jgi:tetratricopeptide (TPR) repeat protein